MAAAAQPAPQAPPTTEEANILWVEIILTQKFIKEHDRNYFFELFKKQSGVIVRLNYMPDQSVAHVRFKSRPAAEHLLRQKEITLEGYSFIIRQLENSTTNVNTQKPRNRRKNAKQNSNVDNDKKPNTSNQSRKNKNSNNKPQNQNENQNGTIASVSTNDLTPLLQNTTTTIDPHRFYLTVSAYNQSEFSTKVERTAAIIAKMKPSSVRLIVANIGKWLIEFTEDKTFGKFYLIFFIILTKNVKLKK